MAEIAELHCDFKCSKQVSATEQIKRNRKISKQ